MGTAQQSEAIERSIDGIAHSIAEAWITLRLLEGINAAAKAGEFRDEGAERCAVQFNRAAFVALYMHLGAIIDNSDDSYSVPNLLRRLRVAWANDRELLRIVDAVDKDLKASDTIGKIRDWRNKIIAHRTNRTQDARFHELKKVTLLEIDSTLDLLEELLDRLSVNVSGVVHTLSSTIPGLEEDVRILFSGNDT